MEKDKIGIEKKEIKTRATAYAIKGRTLNVFLRKKTNVKIQTAIHKGRSQYAQEEKEVRLKGILSRQRPSHVKNNSSANAIIPPSIIVI